MAWAATPAVAQLLVKSVDDGLLIYDPESGSTHLLSPLSEFVLELLAAPASALRSGDIARRLHAETPENPLADCTIAVEQALDLLAQAGLVVAAPLIAP
ncbi:MAG: HPr-rel-A system PqqD family peptide chaperone [Burkholderiaceae bacterium]